MDVLRWLKASSRHRTVLILAGLMTTFAGADLLLNRPKGSGLEWFAIPLLAVGGGLFAWAGLPRGVVPSATRESLAAKFIHILSWRGRLLPYLPIFGIGIAIADLAYNAALSTTPALGTEDTIVIATSASMIAYGFTPRNLARERDFVLLFFFMLNAILVVPLLVARGIYADFEQSVDGYSWVALAPQTSAVLNLLGVGNAVHSVPGSTAPGLTFTPKNLAIQVTVVITTSCSGIYSFGIFASAFMAFIFTEHSRLTRRVWVLLGLGLATAYLANVLRMVVIVLVGYLSDSAQTDLQNLLIAHSYAGWLIFLTWITLFWGLLLKAMPLTSLSTTSPNLEPPHHRRAEARCSICANSLTPTIPSIRCTCGALTHKECSKEAFRCPRCARQLTIASSGPN